MGCQTDIQPTRLRLHAGMMMAHGMGPPHMGMSPQMQSMGGPSGMGEGSLDHQQQQQQGPPMQRRGSHHSSPSKA